MTLRRTKMERMDDARRWVEHLFGCQTVGDMEQWVVRCPHTEFGVDLVESTYHDQVVRQMLSDQHQRLARRAAR